MIKVIKGVIGIRVNGRTRRWDAADGPVTLDPDVEKRFVDSGVAVYVDPENPDVIIANDIPETDVEKRFVDSGVAVYVDPENPDVIIANDIPETDAEKRFVDSGVAVYVDPENPDVIIANDIPETDAENRAEVEDSPDVADGESLDAKTVKELKAMAEELGVEIPKYAKKAEIISLIEEYLSDDEFEEFDPAEAIE